MTTRSLTALLVLLLFSISVPSHAVPLEINIGGIDGGSLIVRGEAESVQELLHKNVVIQQRDYSCGTASLATVFNYYLNKPVDELDIIKTLLEINQKRGTLEEVIKRRGFSMLDLKLFAENQGFKSVGYRLDFEDLVKLGVPAIVPIIPEGFKHFVVFRGADRERVYLADPSFGNLIEPIDRFKKDWMGFTNVALIVIKPGDQKEGHPMALSELDKIFAGQEGVESFIYAVPAFRPLIPGEY